LTITRLVAAVLLAAASLVPVGAAAPAQQEQAAPVRIPLTAGRSTVLTTDFDVKRIAVTNPATADATVVEPREILIDGKAPGTVSLIIWGDGGRRVQYDVAVDAGVAPLQQQFRNLFPGEDINVTTNDEATTLSGHVSNTTVMLTAAEIAAKSSSKQKIINLLQVPGGNASQQVMLQVRFAEVNRQALTELGVSLISGANSKSDWIGRTTTQQFSAPNFNDDGAVTFSDFLNLFVFNTKYNFGAVIKALQQRGFLQSLAEPNLIAYNGQEASFLAGGEVPVPVAQGGNSAGAIGVTYKEFGIRLNFTPTIAGDVIRLKVRPEVSSLDFANGVTAGGIRIPALQTRRAETDVELRDGQSFAIAGLLDNISQETREQIPLLGSLPIIGHLFKSRANSQQRTELMVLITPHLVRPLDPDEVPPLPTDPTRFYRPGEGAGGQMQGAGGTVDGPPVTTAGGPAPKAAAEPAPKKKKGQK
jgi:pilus assembly protein CpaC